MEWIRNEVMAWFWLVVGIGILLGGMVIIDFFTGAVDKLWGKED